MIACVAATTPAPCFADATSEVATVAESPVATGEVSPIADSPIRTPHERPPTYERLEGDVVLVWRRDGSGRIVATCRVWPDARDTCLPHPIPRRFVGPVELAGGFVGIGVGVLAIVIGVNENASCGSATESLGHCGGMAGIGVGSVFAAAGVALVALGGVRTAQHRRGVRELLSAPSPNAPSVRLEFRGTGLGLRASF